MLLSSSSHILKPYSTRCQSPLRSPLLSTSSWRVEPSETKTPLQKQTGMKKKGRDPRPRGRLQRETDSLPLTLTKSSTEARPRMARSWHNRLLAITALVGAATVPTMGLRVRDEGACLPGTAPTGRLHRRLHRMYMYICLCHTAASLGREHAGRDKEGGRISMACCWKRVDRRAEYFA